MLFIAKETVRIDSGVFFRAFLLPYVLHRAEPRILLGYRLPAAGRAHTNDAAFFAARMARLPNELAFFFNLCTLDSVCPFHEKGEVVNIVDVPEGLQRFLKIGFLRRGE
jgi:hypothetical protein